MANKKKNTDPYAPETVRRERSFPKKNSIILGLLIAIQVALVIAACFLPEPSPQDVIRDYRVTASPNRDGTLDLTYTLVWTALDESEELTWIELGMPNENYKVLGVSGPVTEAARFVDGDYVSVQLMLERPFVAGETLEVSVTVRQGAMLCQGDGGYFYEFIPGWFNATPVEHYEIRWENAAEMLSSNADRHEGNVAIWEGEMPCGSFVRTRVSFGASAFDAPATVSYAEFDESGVSNDLAEDRIVGIVMLLLLAALLIIPEVSLTDSFVSYHRGRGFLRGYGYHMHVYGRVNPHYRREQQKHAAYSGRGGSSGRGGFSGGGCACACACACAGGGRAGCSQKNTLELKVE